MVELQRDEFRRIIISVINTTGWPSSRGDAIVSPHDVAEAHGVMLHKSPIPRGLACTSDGARTFYAPGPDARAEGLHAWGGVAQALLLRARIAYDASDVWLLAADLAMPLPAMLRLGAVEAARRQLSAPHWFLRDWAIAQLQRITHVAPPTSGPREIVQR